MFQVLIADDEYLAQEMLSSIIDWEEYGYCIAKIVSNGSEAIDYLKDNHIDVVFSDVCMPLVSGIELANHIKTNYPNTKIIMMSSYSDFDYVRECFSAKAYDYLLKHTLTPESLIHLLDTLSNEQFNNQSVSQITDKEYQKNLEYNNHLTELIYGNISDNTLYKGIVGVAKIGADTLLKFANSQGELRSLYGYIINTITHALKPLTGNVVFQDTNNNFVIYFPFANKTDAETALELRNYIQQINYSVKKFFSFSLHWGISCVSSIDYPLSECYREAITMLKDSPIKYKKKYDISTSTSTLSADDEKSLIVFTQSMNMDNVFHTLERIFDKVPNYNYSLDILISEIITLASKICFDLNIDISLLENVVSPISFDKNKRSVKDEALLWSKNIFKFIINSVKNENKSTSIYSSAIIEYVREHYNEHISREQLAKLVGIAENHLSTTFKAETGETIQEFIMRFRIDKAKELLMQDVDLKYLYTLVGFNNNTYFFSIFKKLVGCTPRQYKMHYNKTHN